MGRQGRKRGKLRGSRIAIDYFTEISAFLAAVTSLITAVVALVSALPGHR